jgi:hypothetical protein
MVWFECYLDSNNAFAVGQLDGVGVFAPFTTQALSTNKGNVSETFTVNLTDTTAGTSVGSQMPTLGASASATLAFSWAVPANASVTTHVLKAEAVPVPGETVTSNNTKTANASVKAPVHDVTVSSISAPSSVTRGGSATITVALTSKSNVSESVTVGLAESPDNSTFAPQTVTLAPGGKANPSFTWVTSAANSEVPTRSPPTPCRCPLRPTPAITRGPKR